MHPAYAAHTKQMTRSLAFGAQKSGHRYESHEQDQQRRRVHGNDALTEQSVAFNLGAIATEQ